MELEEPYSDDGDDVPISKIRLKGIKMKYPIMNEPFSCDYHSTTE